MSTPQPQGGVFYDHRLQFVQTSTARKRLLQSGSMNDGDDVKRDCLYALTKAKNDAGCFGYDAISTRLRTQPLRSYRPYAFGQVQMRRAPIVVLPAAGRYLNTVEPHRLRQSGVRHALFLTSVHLLTKPCRSYLLSVGDAVRTPDLQSHYQFRKPPHLHQRC